LESVDSLKNALPAKPLITLALLVPVQIKTGFSTCPPDQYRHNNLPSQKPEVINCFLKQCVQGNTISGVPQKLRQVYPNRQDFVILSLQWK
jgi:hypothetical protein